MADPLQPIPVPAPSKITVGQVGSGSLIPALDRVKLFSPAEWEDFVREWADSLRSKYVAVLRAGGPGDKGRDIVAFVDAPTASAR